MYLVISLLVLRAGCCSTVSVPDHCLSFYFPKDLLLDYIEITTAVVAQCGGPKNLPVHRYSVVIFTFSVFWGL